jgi:peptide deformylase
LAKKDVMILPIVAYGDTVLRKVARNIEKQESFDLQALIADMFETMYHASGIGIAAPQIGMDIRLFVVDGTEIEDEEEDMKGFKKVFINAQILNETGEKWAMEEGCLSIPGIRENVQRHDELRIKYFDENWNEFEETYTGMKARIIQHEYDHIQGVLFTDHLSPLKKRLLKNKLTNISKGVVDVQYRMKFAGKR